MGQIHVLDTEVSNKIAAGEVVERPASVVKELVENSIDAGATVINVEIKNGGSTYICVSDNGSGMSAEDAATAFLRHATSKISKAEDLDAIYTFGFRGEALSSIGAVADVELVTKRAEDVLAARVTCRGGEIGACSESGAANGTVITVKTLFYNTPARMKFMKKDATEAGYISDIMTRFVLAHPEISFRLISGGREQIFSPGDGSLVNAVYAVYGRDYANSMITAEYEMDGVKVSGVIGKGTLARPNRNFQSFFVNKRYIKSALMIRAAEEAYKNQIMIGKFPVLALNVEVNPALIDINVHPTKLEVKFSNEKHIYEAVYYAVKNALYAVPNVPELKIGGRSEDTEDDKLAELLRAAASGKSTERVNPFIRKTESAHNEFKKEATNKGQIEIEPASRQNQKTSGQAQKQPDVYTAQKPDPFARFRKKNVQNQTSGVFCAAEPAPEQVTASVTGTAEKPDRQGSSEQEKTQSAPEREEIAGTEAANDKAAAADTQPDIAETYENIKIVGQVFDTYIIAQRGNDEMLITDQHAAHERLKYEEIRRAVGEHKMYPQILLEPIVISLSAPELEIYRENADEFTSLGFETEEFGDTDVLVRAAPAEIDWNDIEALFLELLTECANGRKELKGAKQERFLYTVACKAAIKANHDLTYAEMEALVKNVLALEGINTCPHGRPITVSMTKKDLEKQFKRIV